MKISIDREAYEKLGDDDKIRLLIINTDKSFEKEITKTRDELKCRYKEEWQNYLKTRYSETSLLIPVDDKEQKRWLKERKKKAEIGKALASKAGEILEKFYFLDERWRLFVEGLICENDRPWFPSKYSIGEIEGRTCIYIDSLTTKNHLIEWIKANWRMIQANYRVSMTLMPAKLNRKNIPKYENLWTAIDIIDLKDNERRTLVEIARRIYKKKYKWGKKDSKDIENVYYRIKKEIDRFLASWSEIKKIRESI